MLAQKTPVFTIEVYGELQFSQIKDIKHAQILFTLYLMYTTLYP